MKKLTRSEKGQGLVEYALILVLVAIVVLAVLLLLGPVVGNAFSNIVANLNRFSGGGTGVITGVTTSTGFGTFGFTVHVSTKTQVSMSGDVSHAAINCNPSCTFSFTIPPSPAHGNATITATAGGSTSVSW